MIASKVKITRPIRFEVNVDKYLLNISDTSSATKQNKKIDFQEKDFFNLRRLMPVQKKKQTRSEQGKSLIARYWITSKQLSKVVSANDPRIMAAMHTALTITPVSLMFRNILISCMVSDTIDIGQEKFLGLMGLKGVR